MPIEDRPDNEPPHDGIRQTSSIGPESKPAADAESFSRHDENRKGQLAPPDLEQIQQVSSGPAYTVFNKHQKKFIVAMVSLGGFFSPLSANIYFPVLNALARDLKVSNQLINLTLTSYMIFQGFAPTIFGDLGDMTGRRPAYVIGFLIYIGANIGLAFAKSICCIAHYYDVYRALGAVVQWLWAMEW